MPEVLDRIAVGGWPANLTRDLDAALQHNRDYLTNAREVDIPTALGTRRDPARPGRLLRSLARNVATEVKISALARETQAEGETALARSTIYDYLAALERLILVEDVPAWSPQLRSRAALRREAGRAGRHHDHQLRLRPQRRCGRHTHRGPLPLTPGSGARLWRTSARGHGR